jgi:hypothetical protein
MMMRDQNWAWGLTAATGGKDWVCRIPQDGRPQLSLDLNCEIRTTVQPQTRTLLLSEAYRSRLVDLTDQDCEHIPMSGIDDNSAINLQRCEGECDNDAQCADGLKCFQRSNGGSIPGCSGPGWGPDWDCKDLKTG